MQEEYNTDRRSGRRAEASGGVELDAAERLELGCCVMWKGTSVNSLDAKLSIKIGTCLLYYQQLSAASRSPHTNRGMTITLWRGTSRHVCS